MEDDGALYHAVANNELETVRSLIAEGRDIDQFYYDYQGISTKSLLHVACEKGRQECVKILLDAGAMVGIRDKWGQTPLMYCMQAQWYEIAEILLEYCPEHVNARDKYLKSALHCAVESGCEESVLLLLRCGADVGAQTSNGSTPLMTLCSTPDVEAPGPIMKLLLNAGSVVDKKDYHGKRTALQLAALSKNPSLVETLIGTGADVNTIDITGRTPLTNIMLENIRVRDGRCEPEAEVMMIIAMLIQSGADVNITACEYSNPLVVSTFLTADPLVRFFIDNGADPNLSFPSGISPLLVATTKKDPTVVKTLLYHNADMCKRGRISKRRQEYIYNSFELAVDIGCFALARLYTEMGYNVSQHEYLRNSDSQLELPESLQEDKDMLAWLRERANRPIPLMKACIFRIRHIFGTKIESCVGSLTLPDQIKDMVLMKDLLS